MLIFDGTINHDIITFLRRVTQETSINTIVLYQDWINDCSTHCSHATTPRGIVLMRILPSIAYARIQKRALPEESSLSLETLEQIYIHQEELFIHRKGLSQHLIDLPVLVLNGNIDFQTNFAQFYNHLFYIKKFLKDLKDKNDMIQGTYKSPQHRHCC